MALCVIDEDRKHAPGCYLICQVDENGDWDTWSEERTILVQYDWEIPSLAFNFGWVPCFCGETDGTVDCPHRTVSEMIDEAREWVDRHLGVPFEDPGYFD